MFELVYVLRGAGMSKFLEAGIDVLSVMGFVENDWEFVNRVYGWVKRNNGDGFGRGDMGVVGIVGDIIEDMGELRAGLSAGDFSEGDVRKFVEGWGRLGKELAEVLSGRFGVRIERGWLVRLRNLGSGIRHLA